jgi:hypothetical protein
MGLFGRIDGSEPIRPAGEPAGDLHIATRSCVMATGTLACPGCDAPVAPGPVPMAPADPLFCPVCDHAGAVRDFLSLEPPTRPARVEVRLVRREPLPA